MTNTLKSSPRTSLVDALFSGTRQKVLGLFFTQPEHAFTLKDVIDQVGAGSGGVQREVTRLVDSGLVTLTVERRRKTYKANPEAPIYPELVSLIAKTLGPVPQIGDALRALDDEIDLALIYGSVAKKTDHADSDIDVMLVSDSLTLDDVLAVLEPVESRLSRPINPTLYKKAEFEKRRANNNPFLGKVLKGQYILLKGVIDESGSA